LVDFHLAFRAYASCDPHAEVDKEAYLSAFTYPADFRRHLETTGSSRGYGGPCGAHRLWFDLDGDDLDATLNDARRLAVGTLHRYPSLDDDDLLLFYSGSKGFHLGLPLIWNPEPAPAFNRVAKHFAVRLAEEAGVNVDGGVYDKVRLFRAPNSRHPKSGLHKRRLSLDELLHLSGERIRRLATTPEPFEVPTAPGADPQAVADWAEAEKQVQKEAEAREQRRAAGGGAPMLNRLTLEFIHDGAAVGDRHRLLFSAAANLAEFNCPPALAHALLTEAALDSGLPPAEVRRQIECGLQRAPTAPPPPKGSEADHLRERLAALWCKGGRQ
jgi:hypothetical protein